MRPGALSQPAPLLADSVAKVETCRSWAKGIAPDTSEESADATATAFVKAKHTSAANPGQAKDRDR